MSSRSLVLATLAPVAALLPATLFVLACSSDPEPAPACDPLPAAVADPNCTPAYEPTYDNLFAQTFSKSCALSGASCHASSGKQGGIDFENADEAYAALVSRNQDVKPGDPACSPLAQRIVSTDGLFRMPPGGLLPEGEQCAIVRWIASGAKR